MQFRQYSLLFNISSGKCTGRTLDGGILPGRDYIFRTDVEIYIFAAPEKAGPLAQLVRASDS
jgi:hypothetical protein